MRERRLTVAAVVLLLLAAAWTRQPAVHVAVVAQPIEQLPATAQAELDLGALGVLALGWTARKLAPR